MAMCISWGVFVPAYEADDGLDVATDRCPSCGDTQFRATVSGRYIDLD